jgi:hypothetical protein
MKEPKSMQEIHKIREKLYEKWKNMSKDEILQYIEDCAENVRKDLQEK